MKPLAFAEDAAGYGISIATNVLGLPMVTIPMGASAAGLPIGVQLVGRPYEDELLLELAVRLEATMATACWLTDSCRNATRGSIRNAPSAGARIAAVRMFGRAANPEARPQRQAARPDA